VPWVKTLREYSGDDLLDHGRFIVSSPSKWEPMRGEPVGCRFSGREGGRDREGSRDRDGDGRMVPNDNFMWLDNEGKYFRKGKGGLAWYGDEVGSSVSEPVERIKESGEDVGGGD
jgi:hypothetical protein